MLIKRVVINASPLIVLFKSQQADRAARRCAQSFNIITLGTGRYESDL